MLNTESERISKKYVFNKQYKLINIFKNIRKPTLKKAYGLNILFKKVQNKAKKQNCK